MSVLHPDEEAPAVGGGRGWVLETGCRRVSRRFDPARRWLAIGKDGVWRTPATIRQVGRCSLVCGSGLPELRVLSVGRFELRDQPIKRLN
jgi:hypothetical protein